MLRIVTLFLLFVFLYGCTHSNEPLVLKDVDHQTISSELKRLSKDRTVLVNVWATWCKPCVEEFDDLVRIDSIYNSLDVVFISADFDKDKALDFLNKKELNGLSYFKTGDDMSFIDSLSIDWSGALPYTQIIKNGKILDQWEDKSTLENIEKRLSKLKIINP